MKYFKANFENHENYKGIEITAIKHGDGVILVTEMKKEDNHQRPDSIQYLVLCSLEKVLQDHVDEGATIVDIKL